MTRNRTDQFPVPMVSLFRERPTVCLYDYPGGRTTLELQLVSLIVAEEREFDGYLDAGGLQPKSLQLMPEEALRRVLQAGFGSFSDGDLIELTTNYLALAEIRDAVREEDNLSDYWLHAFAVRPESRSSLHTRTRAGAERVAPHWHFQVLLKRAAIVLLSLGLLTTTVAAVHYWNEWEQLLQQKRAIPIPPTPQEALKAALNNAFRIGLSTMPGSNGLVQLSFSPMAQPPYVVAINVDWGDGSDPQEVFLAGKTFLTPAVQHDFTPMLPKGGGDLLKNITVTFDVTGAAMDAVGPQVKRTLAVRLTSAGIQPASSQNSSGTHVGVQNPTNGQTVSDPFFLDFTVSHSEGGDALPTGRLHILVRPLDGQTDLGDEYYVVPFQEAPEATPGPEHQYHVLVPLGALVKLNLPPNKRPTHFEILIVELPVILTDWQLPKNQFDFSTPPLAGTMKVAAIQIVVKPPEAK